jgi:twitching motility protein PilT
VPRVDELLCRLRERGGSDLHLAAGREPRMRVDGELLPVDFWDRLETDALLGLMRPIANEHQWRSYERCGDVDFAYGLQGVARFRVNYFRQEHGAGAVFRIIPEKIVALEDLDLPESIGRFVELSKGLVLVTGPTGSGKSTTLAAIIDRINRTQAKHIVTLEDPVEFVHQNKRSVFSHREVGTHTAGFAPGLRAALREDADVILVGELRDYETISLAMTAAEMGMLVFATLHTSGAAKTVDRIIDSFPNKEQPQARLSLSESLAGIVSQLLLPHADDAGRRAAVEILFRTPALPNLIREGNIPMLNDLIQSGKKDGMQSMDDALFDLLQQRVVRPQDAFVKANDKARFEPFLPRD